MTEQLALCFAPRRRARRADPHTSREAASGAGDVVGEHCRRILDVLDRGLTIYEIAERAGLTHVQVARRMPDLEDAAMARRRVIGADDDGTLRYATRPSPTGRRCALWERIG
jgi:hypothetical protein